MASETRTVGWLNWRATSTTTSETWRNNTSETSWVDNRPVLSRIKSWFGRGDNNTIRNETVQPAPGQPVIVQPMATGQEFYRKLPTTSEPPLGNAPAAPKSFQGAPTGTPPTVQPKPAAPTSQQPAPRAPTVEQPLTVEVEPIEFRAAGQAKGITPSISSSAPPTAISVPSSRPNPISPRFVEKVGQPGDYSWITGQLEIRNGTCMLHYATPETIDRYNGSLILSAEGKLGNVRHGDLVSVHGNVVQTGRGATYRVQTIDLIER